MFFSHLLVVCTDFNNSYKLFSMQGTCKLQADAVIFQAEYGHCLN